VGFEPTIPVSELAKTLFIVTVYSLSYELWKRRMYYVFEPKYAAPVTVLRQAHSAGVKEKLPETPGKGGDWIVQSGE
jgi:hypothetical protein